MESRKKRADRGLILAIFKHQHPELDFHTYSRPRLDGLIKYFRFKNLGSISAVNEKAQRLKSESIPFALSGDFLVRVVVPQNPKATDDEGILMFPFPNQVANIAFIGILFSVIAYENR